MSDKIRATHLARKAILYVRQSSAYQVAHYRESQRLQYAMRDRLSQLGWREIEVVDEDLGRSAAGLVTRSGFERMVADVCLGKVGAVAAREVSRFARNSREWQQLVEVCRVVDTVLIDQDTIYAPRVSNDRLLLGLKGSLNEYELDLLRQRSVEARRQKALRGELLIVSPVGYLKGEQRLEKDPNQRVQEAIALVFRKVLELGSVRQTLLWFHDHGLELPAIDAREQVRWRRPSYGMVYSMLTNPIYGGAYTYGRTEQVTRYRDGSAQQSIRRKPRHEWLAFIPGAHEGYVSWAGRSSSVSKRLSRRTRWGVGRLAALNGARRSWAGCCAVGAVVISCWSGTRAIGTTCCATSAGAGGSTMPSLAASASRAWRSIGWCPRRSCAWCNQRPSRRPVLPVRTPPANSTT
jgi:DNA invertase Pin-like site-specific DNA recombinase